jgi:5-methylcytosine-specific restriction enzyme subunit McrC
MNGSSTHHANVDAEPTQTVDLLTGVPVPGSSAMPRVIECEEYGTIDVPLEKVLTKSGKLNLHSSVERGDYFAVNMKRGALTLQARGFIGLIPLNDQLVVQVKPRVPIKNLTRIAEIAGMPATVLSFVRNYGTESRWSDSLIGIYAGALVEHVEDIIRYGFFREYSRQEEVSSFPRGRVILNRSIRSLESRGIHHAAHVSWYQRSIDNASNRCLKYALWTIAQHFIREPPNDRAGRILHRRVSALHSMFDGVDLDYQRLFLSDAIVSGYRDLPALRSYYRDALEVSLAIIHQRAIMMEDTSGNLRLPSMVLDTARAFEAYIRQVLSLFAAEEGWRLSVLDGNAEGKRPLFAPSPKLPSFPTAVPPDATPDVVLRAADEVTPLVLEVKNVPLKGISELSSRDAINQAVTYAVTYRTNQVLLIHPCAAGQANGMRLLGKVGDIKVHQYRFNLAAADLPGEDALFASAVAELLPPSLVSD